MLGSRRRRRLPLIQRINAPAPRIAAITATRPARAATRRSARTSRPRTPRSGARLGADPRAGPHRLKWRSAGFFSSALSTATRAAAGGTVSGANPLDRGRSRATRPTLDAPPNGRRPPRIVSQEDAEREDVAARVERRARRACSGDICARCRRSRHAPVRSTAVPRQDDVVRRRGDARQATKSEKLRVTGISCEHALSGA